jgi:hypothetical protein
MPVVFTSAETINAALTRHKFAGIQTNRIDKKFYLFTQIVIVGCRSWNLEFVTM